MRRFILFVVVAALGITVAVSAVPRGGDEKTPDDDWRGLAAGNWPTVGGDWGNTRYSSLTQINVDTVKNLRGAWLRELDAESRATPVVVNGVMFTASASRIYALN